MKEFHSIECRVISEPLDEKEDVIAGFYYLLAADYTKEVSVQKDSFRDQEGNERFMFTMKVLKPQLVKQMVTNLLESISRQDMATLIKQLPTRVDDECCFYIRIDKNAFLIERVAHITEGGSCFHFTLNVASYPKKREVALQTVEKYLKMTWDKRPDGAR